MRLDTSIRQNEAKGLYARLGFRAIKPYYQALKNAWLAGIYGTKAVS